MKSFSFKFKLKKIHLFVFLLFALLLSYLFLKDYQREYMTTVNKYTGPAGNTVYTYNNNYDSSNNDYDSSYNYVVAGQGVTINDIPPGDEDLYILKSQVVPPVCPACPTIAECPRTEPPPPCPPCARCPEPAFECKKVPNYELPGNPWLPEPILDDYATYGI